MVKIHDNWYKKLFSNPSIVEDLLTAFVKEEFVQNLDYSSIKKLNTSFVSDEFKNRESDVIYEIKSKLYLSVPQTGHFQSSGRSLKSVPAGTPCSGSPAAGS